MEPDPLRVRPDPTAMGDARASELLRIVRGSPALDRALGARATLEPDLWPPTRQRELLEVLIGPLLGSLDAP